MIKKIQLPLQTMNLIVGFMIWVLISSLLPFIKEDIAIPESQLALVTAVPVILGSILRIPLGLLCESVWGENSFSIKLYSVDLPSLLY